MATHNITATSRKVEGKGASRRLRHSGQVPAIVYGAQSAPENVQLELLTRVFNDWPFEAWLLELTRDLEAGRLDEELVFRKKKKENDVAEELDLVMTVRGLEPAGEPAAPIDYGHYLEKQLGPVCDVILPFLDTSFARICGTQTSLF